MLAFNIVLVILGVVIPIGMVIFWSKARKIFYNRLDDKSYAGSIVTGNISVYNFIGWLYRHKSIFNIFIVTIVTIIEFLALIPF